MEGKILQRDEIEEEAHPRGDGPYPASRTILPRHREHRQGAHQSSILLPPHPL